MKRLKRGTAAVTALAFTVAGCASSPDSIDARYVSPTMYQGWSCAQLMDEKQRLASEVSRVSDLQRENANTDAAMMGVGLVLFWPALFALAATKDRKEELGRLKGEHEAVDHGIREKQCALTPPPTIPAVQEVSAPATAPAPVPAVQEISAPATAPASAAPAVQEIAAPAVAPAATPAVQEVSAPATVPAAQPAAAAAAAPATTAPPAASTAVAAPVTPAPVPVAIAPADPNESVVCQEGDTVLPRTRGVCLVNAGKIL